jgi:aminoglycoside phosphotransferase (APT) family kinase protein
VSDSLRQGWGRGSATLQVPPAALGVLAAELFDGAAVTAVETLSGGLANTNIRLDLDRAPGRVVLRLAQRDPAALGREAALLRLAASRGIPAAVLLHAETDATRLGAPFLLLGFVEGVMLEAALAGADDSTVADLGYAVGELLAAVHGVGFEEAGFLDSELAVATPIDAGGEGLKAYAAAMAANPLVAERLGAARLARLAGVLDEQAGRLDAWSGRPCLAHADANGSNILVARETGLWRVVALLDWEFAFAGTPYFDLGNAIRPPAGENPLWLTGIDAGYRSAGGALPADWPDLARLADLTAWLDFASRPEATPALLADCKAMIDRVAGVA